MKLDRDRTTAIKTRLLVVWFRECKQIAKMMHTDVDAAKARLTTLMRSIADQLQADDIQIETSND